MGNQTIEFVRTLFANSKDDLVRFLNLRLRNTEDARDIAQEAYMRLLRLDRTDLVRHPEAYLFRIAANLVHEHWLKVRATRDVTFEAIEAELVADDLEPMELQAEYWQSLDALTRVLRALPVMQRKAVLLHRRDGMTYKEIAVQLKTSPDMVKKHLAKGLARCREGLRRYHHD